MKAAGSRLPAAGIARGAAGNYHMIQYCIIMMPAEYTVCCEARGRPSSRCRGRRRAAARAQGIDRGVRASAGSAVR